jgi:hypothetical protein
MEAQSVNTIICPSCGADLGVAMTRCDHCGASTQGRSSQPATIPSAERILDRPWILVVLLLHVGLLGIPIYWRTKYSVPTRLAIILASIVYTVVALAIIYWAAMKILQFIQVISN